MNKKPLYVTLLIGLSMLITISCGITLSLKDTPVPEALPVEPQQDPVQPAEPQSPAPIEQPEAQEVQPPAAPDVNFEGVSFSYDHSLASGVDFSRVESQVYPDAPDWGNETAHLEFIFNGYLLQETFHKPAIYIYSATDLQNTQTGTDTLETLEIFLQNQPAALGEDESIPLLPFFNAAQFMQARISYIDFQNGRGVRFLSQYGQAAWPVNNHDMFYTFQGVTTDQQYYISAVFPVSHPTLPPTGDNIPGGDWGAFSDNFRPYLLETEAALDQQPDPSFTPNLVILDDIIHSLKLQ
jgi:hypothetical protein